METSKKPQVLCILDGFGITQDTPNNSILKARLPHVHHLFETYPWMLLNADGEAVGMENGNVGNSEVGHMNLGAAHLVRQLSLDITQSAHTQFQDDNLYNTQHFKPTDLISTAHVHIIGLISTGRVHSDIRHIETMIDVIQAQHKTPIIHIITDGRDSDPYTSTEVIKGFIKRHPNILLGSISGRFYAMDRDNNLDRTQRYMDVITRRQDKHVEDILSYIRYSYSNKENDETLSPASLGNAISPEDDIILMNYRTDRFRQITKSLIEWRKEHRARGAMIGLNDYGLKDYPATISHTTNTNHTYYALFSAEPPSTRISTYLSQKHYTQLHTAETEKYNHVTYFFNGGQNLSEDGEDWHIIPSNKVKSHAEKPEMKASEVTNYIIEHADQYDYILVNYANPDMLGHTGDLEATIESLQHLDDQLKRLTDHILNLGGSITITADHGNSECVGHVKEANGQSHLDSSHNDNPVPLLVVSESFNQKRIKENLLKTKQEFDNDGTVEFLDSMKKGLFKDGYRRESVYPLWYAGWLWISL